MDCFLGVDAGGTKTLALLAAADGRLLGRGHGGSANFQDCGVAGAQGQIRWAVDQALVQAASSLEDIRSACFGVAGADRPKDFDTIRSFLGPLLPPQAIRLENDTLIALRAGTDDGVGVALVAGTGSNAMGQDRAGSTLQVGGLGSLTGDVASARAIGKQAVVAAFHGLDGRGPPTLLSQSIKEHLGLSEFRDIIELDFFDAPGPPLDTGRLAPLVFAAAAAGDEVAMHMLEETGRELARALLVILDRLFCDAREPVPVVLGGAVLQSGASSHLVDALVKASSACRVPTRFVRLDLPPAAGALGFAFDGLPGLAEPKAFARLRADLQALPLPDVALAAR